METSEEKMVLATQTCHWFLLGGTLSPPTTPSRTPSEGTTIICYLNMVSSE